MYAVDNELYALRLTFYEEADERLAELEESLQGLARHADDRDVLNSIFRAVHSIKGGSAACDHAELTRFAHAFENLLSSLRRGALSVDAQLLDVLLQAKDVLDALVCAARENRHGSEDARVARSVAAISAALAQLSEIKEDTPRHEDLVDLSGGFAIWGDETEPAPAISIDRSLQPSLRVGVDSTVQHEGAPLLETVSTDSLLASSGSIAQLKSLPPSLSGMQTIPITARPQTTPRQTREPHLSLAPQKSIAPCISEQVPLAALPDRSMDGVVVRVGPQLYVLSTAIVERFVQPELSALRSVPKNGELLLTELGALPLFSLETLLGRAPRRSVPSTRVAVLLRTGRGHVALLVDEVLTQGDVSVKSIEQNVGKVRGVSGAVVLDKCLALVLECEALFAPARVLSLNPNAI